jgi:aspartate/glutamate racemase
MISSNRTSPSPLVASRLAVLAFLALALAPSSLRANELDPRSFDDVTRYVETEAGPKELAALARRQFYFEVTSDHEAGAQQYARMQQAIAQKIPVEYERPVFDVRFIFGDKAAISDAQTIGILGGTGPLSDANIIRLVMARARDGQVGNGVMVHLFSLPPPRTTTDQIMGGATYSARLTRFMRHGYGNYFLASNTAHLNFDTLKTISGSNHLRHLPRIIVDRIAAAQQREHRQETLLILGTRQAWDGHLYDTILDAKSMAYGRLDLDRQVALQGWIDQIKQGLVTDAQRGTLESFISNLGRQYGANGLLLSCTELPLGLGDQIAALRAEGFAVYDSEALIAEIIAEVVHDPALGDSLGGS